MVSRSRLVVAAVIGAIAVAALAGCSGSGGAPVDDYSGLPRGVDEAPSGDSGSFASWLSEGDQIAVTIFGSSTCPRVGESMEVRSSNWLVVTLEPLSDEVCTQDFVPHTTVFDTPSSVTTTSDVTIQVSGSTITLPALR